MRNEVIVHIHEDSSLANPKAVRKFFDQLKGGNKYLVTAKNINRRTTSQNAYLHGVVIPLVFDGLRNNGYDDVRDHEDAKLVIKTLFLKRKVSNGMETIEIVKRTSELTTTEFSLFIDEVAKWCSEYLNFYLPMPNEQSELYKINN